MKALKISRKFARHPHPRSRARIQIGYLALLAATAAVAIGCHHGAASSSVPGTGTNDQLSAGQMEMNAYSTNFTLTRMQIERTDFGGVWGATISFGLKNNGDRAVTGIKVTINMMDTNGNICDQEPFVPFYDKTNDPLLPGQSWGTPANDPVIIPGLPDSWQGGFDYLVITNVQFQK